MISNTIIVCVGLTIDLQHAMGALAFLVVIHKLEYFLNSKIIGDRIRNPVWLTLLGLILGVLRWRSSSVWPGVAIHAANNVIAIAGLLLATR